MFRIIREINETIKLANQIADQGGDGPRWSLYFTNRSFVAQVVALLFAVLGTFGIFLPIEAGDLVQLVGAVGLIAGFAWSFVERIRGKTRTIWNTSQADKAVEEAIAVAVAKDVEGDRLTAALNIAIK